MPSRAWLPPVFLLLALLAFVGGAASARHPAAGIPASVVIPAPDTPPRDAILDAVRAGLGVTGRLSVDHLAMATADTNWAFVRATEVVAVEGAGDQAREPERGVMALLALPPDADGRAWRVVEAWTVADDAEQPRRDFVRRVRARQAAAELPAALLPADLLRPDR